MLNFQLIQEMIDFSCIEVNEIHSHHEALNQNAQKFQKMIESWLTKFDIECEQEKLNVMLPEYFKTIISGDYGHDFYVIQYRQAMHWRLCGLTQSKSLILMSHIRKLFIQFAEQAQSHNLAKGLCHVMDMSQTIVSTVYQISEEVQTMRNHVKHELNRLDRSFSLISMDVPDALIQPYLDHQEWKFTAFSAALGEEIHAENLQLSHHKCRLGCWLHEHGDNAIPEEDREGFHRAHHRIHELGALAIRHADLKQPEKIVQILHEMEAASQVVSDALLNMIEDEFVRLATSDALTGMANRRSFDLEFERSIAFAERHNYWVGLVLIDIDFFKSINDQHGHLVGDQILREISKLLKISTRIEELTFRWGGEEFAIMTLDSEPNAIFKLAERIRGIIEKHTFNSNRLPMNLTVSCGAVCFQPPCSIPNHEVFAVADKQLYLAKENGRNQVQSKILDATLKVKVS